jgi:hypothetical protein
MKLVIVITGEGVEDLFVVGPKDIHKFLKVKSSDVKKCWFEEVTDEEFEKKIKGEKYKVTRHKDNIY